jgi:hypothetical protein
VKGRSIHSSAGEGEEGRGERERQKERYEKVTLFCLLISSYWYNE